MSVKTGLTQEQIILYGDLIDSSREPLLLHFLRTPDQLLHQWYSQICFLFATVEAMFAHAFQLNRLGGNLRFILLQKAFHHQVQLGSIVSKTLGDFDLAVGCLDLDPAHELALFATTGSAQNPGSVQGATRTS